MRYFLAMYFAIFCSLIVLVVASSLEYKWSSSWEGGNDSEDPEVIHTAFIQTGEELVYFKDPRCMDMVKKTSPDGKAEHEIGRSPPSNAKSKSFYVKEKSFDDGSPPLPLQFDPPFLEFGDQPVAVPQRKKIVIRNVLSEEVIVDSVMGNSLMFHADFVKPSEIPPQGEAAFEVSFSPRENGKIIATLKLSTSVGVFYYEVSGSSSSNPYRVSPYVGIRMSFNQTITKDIEIFNPHPETLRIVSIADADECSHVELPYNINRLSVPGSNYVIDIKPYQKKVIAKLNIFGSMEDNSTVYLNVLCHVINDRGVVLREVRLLLTQPYQIVDVPGVYVTNELLDFGILKIGERSLYQLFDVYQYKLNGKVEFETIYVDKGDATGLYMEFLKNPPISVYAGRAGKPGKSETLVKVVFDTAKMTFPDDKPSKRLSAGRIFAITRGGNYNITLPYRAIIYQGDLKPVENDLAIHHSIRPPHRRAVRILNELPFGIVIYNVTVAPDVIPYFTVRLFSKAVEIPEGGVKETFLLKYNKRVPQSFETAFIYLQTNTSMFRVKLTMFTGEMELKFFTKADPFSDFLDYGLMQRNDTKRIRFGVKNENPAVMYLRSLSAPAKSFRLHHVGDVPIAEDGAVDIQINDDQRRLLMRGKDLKVAPLTMTILDLELHQPTEEASDNLKFAISTDYESIVQRIRYELGQGSLDAIPDHLNFGLTHPGKVVYRNLQIFNGFTEDVTVASLSTMYKDPRIWFELFDPLAPPTVRSGRLANLGRVLFMPNVHSAADWSYLGVRVDAHDTDNDARWFIIGMGLPQNLAEIDGYLYRRFRSKYDKLVASGRHLVNTSVILHTNKAKNVEIPASAELTWPRLLTRDSVHFPLTAVGNFTILNLTMANPTKEPIVVQVIPLAIHPNPDAAVKEFMEHLVTPLTSNVETNETLMFSLRDTELFTLKMDTPVPKLREELEAVIQTSVPKFTLSFLLKPHMKVRLRLGFLPNDYALKSTLLFIRNNLTMVEPVVVYGRGARIGMAVEGLRARSKQPLLFEIRHEHLTDCNNPKRLTHKLTSTLTVRRPFNVTNTGEVPFTVTEMRISNIPCENRGFRILNCYPFHLMPNESYNLDVAYTPDFLSTVNDADLQLYMHMNGSSWTFPLAATVPADMLSRCHRALPRPPFENLMYYSCVMALVFCLVCVLACAYLEGDRAISQAISAQYGNTSRPFDLNASPETTQDQKQVQPVVDACLPSNFLFRADEGASVLKQTVYFVVNIVMRAVHFVWQFFRTSQPPTPQQNQQNHKKKKRGHAQHVQPATLLEATKATVSSTNGKLTCRVRPTPPVIEEIPQQISAKTLESQQPVSKAKDKGKAAQIQKKPAAPLKSSNVELSPKIKVNRPSRRADEPENDKLMEAERLMDDADGAEKKAAEAASKIAKNLKPPVPSTSSSRESTPPATAKPRPPVTPQAAAKPPPAKEKDVPKKPKATRRQSSPRVPRTVLTPPPQSQPTAAMNEPEPQNVASEAMPPQEIPQLHPDLQQLQMQIIQNFMAMSPDLQMLAAAQAMPGMGMPVLPLAGAAPMMTQTGLNMGMPGVLPGYYEDQNRPATPTPSVASSFDLKLIDQYGRPRTDSDARVRRDSDTNSDGSGAPDWAEEDVDQDDADEDFSALHTATMDMTDDEWDNEAAGLRRRRNPSPQNDQGTTTTTVPMFAPPAARQDSFSDWPMPNMMSTFDLQPTDPSAARNSVWAAWESAPNVPSTSAAASSTAQENHGYDPLHSGLSLPLGSLFGGSEFSMWSNQQPSSNHEISQALFHLLPDAQEKPDAKKKD